MQTGQARGNQADPINLRNHISRRTQYGRQGRNPTGPLTAKAQGKKIGQGVNIALAQIGSDQQGQKTKTARPAQHVGQAPWLVPHSGKTLQIKAARQADERSGTHPIGRSGHTVIDRRDTAARHVILVHIGGASGDADSGIQHQCQRQKNTCYPGLRQARILGQTQP